MALLYSIHDRDAHPLIPSGGWCVDAVLVSDEPPNYAAIRSDINWIIRLNHGWNPNGTIPVRSGYADYAKRCADFVERCKGANIFVISNEPNHAQEYPHGVHISPEDYADCFNLCYKAIKQVRTTAQVLTAAVAPWDITSGIDWLAYYKRMLNAVERCDGLAVHGYTHGADPELVWSNEKTHGWYWHFPVIFQTIEAIPAKFASLPVHVTETDQGDNAWVNANTGWVQEAYNSIEGYNGLESSQKIMSLSLYRWRGDKYEIYNKNGVIDDFRTAVQRGYQSPIPSPIPEPPDPWPPEPTPEPPMPEPAPEPEREIDPALAMRGVTFDFAEPAAGTHYWRIVKAEWLDEAEADAVGPDHHILGNTMRGPNHEVNVPLLVSWPSGSTIIRSKPPQPTVSYNYDFPMSSSLNEFSICVDDGALSDKASGIGMGMNGNPSIHTSTWIDWEWTLAEDKPTPPTPQPIHTEYVIAPDGANLRAEPVTGAILIAVPYGEAVQVDGEQNGSDGYIWMHSRYAYVAGWIRGDLLSLEAPRPTPPVPVPDGEVVHPVPGAVITTHWGETAPEYSRGMWGHSGVDLAAPVGTAIRAVADGVVDFVDFDGDGYGHFLFVTHRQLGRKSFYAHCESIDARVGLVVKAGETIARVGSSGNSSGPHTHFEMRQLDDSGSYAATSPMPKGRIDPETDMSLHGVKL